jgi:hypothetical protein
MSCAARPALRRQTTTPAARIRIARAHVKLKLFMSFVRRRLSWLIGAWLLCQIANVAAAPLTFCCQNVATAGDEEKCCPGLLPGQVCPMHHTKEGERTCKMRGVCSGSDASIVALAGGLGAMPLPTAVVSIFDLGDLPRSAPRPAILRSGRPESPPPRA